MLRPVPFGFPNPGISRTMLRGTSKRPPDLHAVARLLHDGRLAGPACRTSAEDESGRSVIIENQLERSNHDHLGKVITYLASYGAETAIWIVADPRPEHVAAVTWLNESSPASFYLFKVEAVRIGVSAPAPLLTRIVGPSAETQAIGITKKERSERASIRRRFWTGLLDHARIAEQAPLGAQRRPTVRTSAALPLSAGSASTTA